MTTLIKFRQNRSFLGRNGVFKCSAIAINTIGRPNSPGVLIEPITSRNRIGKCFIIIPQDNIQDLINTLEKIK